MHVRAGESTAFPLNLAKANLIVISHCGRRSSHRLTPLHHSYMVYTVLDIGVGISWISKATVCAMQKQFAGFDVVYTCDGVQHQLVLTDGNAVLSGRQMYSLTATIMTPWALVSIWLTLAVVPGVDDPLTTSAKR